MDPALDHVRLPLGRWHGRLVENELRKEEDRRERIVDRVEWQKRAQWKTDLGVPLDLDPHRSREVEVEQRVAGSLDDSMPVAGRELRLQDTM